MKFVLAILILVTIYSCISIKKSNEFYCFEYLKNYTVKFSSSPAWIVHKGVEYSKEELTSLKSDSPIGIKYNINTCRGELLDLELIEKNALSHKDALVASTKQKILEGLKRNFNIDVLPIREGEEVTCDSSLIVYIWVK